MSRLAPSVMYPALQADIDADAEQRFENVVRYLVALPSDSRRAEFLLETAEKHCEDLANRLRTATFERMKDQKRRVSPGKPNRGAAHDQETAWA